MMLEQRVIKKDGKVIGYREESNLMLIERTKREVAERSEKKEISRKADRMLKVWARWNHSNTGYGASALAHGDNVRMPPRSKPPFGCGDAPDEVVSVMSALIRMAETSQVNRRYSVILKNVYMGQQNNETIEQAVKRLQLNITTRTFRNAREKFGKFLFP